MSELKPCPFCGNNPTLLNLAGWELMCSCGADMVLRLPNRAGLIAAWNRRAIIDPPAQGEAVAIQREEIEHLRQGFRWVHDLLPMDEINRAAVGAFHHAADQLVIRLGGESTRDGMATTTAPPAQQPAGEAVSVPRALLARISDLLDGEWTISSYAECSYCGKQLGKDHQCELTDIERELQALLDGREG